METGEKMNKDIDILIEQLSNKDNNTACHAAEKLVEISKSSNEVYKYFDVFSKMMNSEKSYERNRSFLIIGENAIWDTDNKINRIIEEYLCHVVDEKPISSRMCIKSLEKIIRNKPELKKEIFEFLRNVDLTCYKDSMRPLIQADISRLLNESAMKSENSDEYFCKIYEILCESFPEDETREKQDFISLMNNKYFKALTKYEKGEIIGFMGFWEFEKFGFLEYFAVKPKKRCNGIGTSMIRELLSHCENPVCLEAEPPKTGMMASRRIEFYKRMGFCVNEFSYMQPAYSENKNSIELLILSYPRKLSKEEFEEYSSIIYREVYKKT